MKRISGADNYPTIPLSPLTHIPGICNFQPFDVSKVYLFCNLHFMCHDDISNSIFSLIEIIVINYGGSIIILKA